MPHLLALGFGFSAKALAARLDRHAWQVTGTARSDAGCAAMTAAGVDAWLWPGGPMPDLSTVTHVLSSVPPTAEGDAAHAFLHATPLPSLAWAGLLSTTGVYGDHGGAWVDETTPLVPSGHRGGLRATQNAAWMTLYETRDLPLHIFRLAGIYGPGRSAIDRMRDGTARRIVKPGQVFSRIHVADIAETVLQSFARPNPGQAYNLADDLPAPPQDVIAEAARLLGLPKPPDLPFETAPLSPMARSFYADNKRISNARIKAELGVRLRYPDYFRGLAAILEREAGRDGA
ncbi:MAG: SDR family oxidoreductase [Pseudomonadota bacterium]